MNNVIQAAERLKAGITHHDYFGPQPDDCAIYISGTDDTLYELPYGEGQTSGQFALGDLRDILQFLVEQGYV